jgi:hypothetical protein
MRYEIVEAALTDRAAGYRRIAAYGHYPETDGFVSFEKRLPSLALAA